jgi:hypothetical protein
MRRQLPAICKYKASRKEEHQNTPAKTKLKPQQKAPEAH